MEEFRVDERTFDPKSDIEELLGSYQADYQRLVELARERARESTGLTDPVDQASALLVRAMALRHKGGWSGSARDVAERVGNVLSGNANDTFSLAFMFAELDSILRFASFLLETKDR